MLKRFLTVICSALLIIFVTSTFAQNATPLPVDSIAAIINDDVITMNQLNKQIQIVQAQMKAAKQSIPKYKILRSQVLDQIINEKLQLDVAKQANISVTEDEFNVGLKQVAAARQMTLDQLYQNVKKLGWTIKDFKNEIKNEMIIRKLQAKEVAPKVKINPEDVDDAIRAYTQANPPAPNYQIKDLLIPLPDKTTKHQIFLARKFANVLANQLKLDTKFDYQVLQNVYPNKNFTINDLGWRKINELPSIFATYAKTMKIGDIVGPIETPNGFHIIKLIGKHQPAIQNLVEEAQIQIIFLNHSAKIGDKILENKLSALRNQIVKGASFDELARKYSQDRASAKLGGYVGWVTLGQYDPTLDAIIKNMKTGETSQPVSTEKGLYLVKLITKKISAKISPEKRKQFEQIVFQRKLNEEIQNFVNELRSQAYIKIQLN